MVVVDNENIQLVIDAINSAPSIAIDTETTGLYPYKEDRLFSIIVATQENDYYFNFNARCDHLLNKPICLLSRNEIPNIIRKNYSGRIFFHNQKFDMKFLALEGLDLSNHNCYDTVVLARLEKNERLSLKLETLAKIVKLDKIDAVKEYVKKHKLYKDGDSKQKQYDLVPFDLMSEYGCMDAHITLKLGHLLLDNIKKQDSRNNNEKKLKDILKIERDLTPILYNMKEKGILIDKQFILEGIEYEQNKYKQYAQKYEEITGIPFIDSNKNHAKAFFNIGEKYPLTEKGNPSFNKEALESMDTELAHCIKDYRYSYKKVHTYFDNFLFLADDNNVIHADLNQSQGRTGRMSSSTPNLQNLTRPHEGEQYQVRQAFIPFDTFFMLDFDQFEYRMMLNKAKEMGVIEQVLSGLDVHTATANMMGVPRQQAKTINFLLLYGGGIAVLARALFKTHLSEHTLKAIQKMHFDRDTHYSISSIASILKLENWEVSHGVEILVKALDLKRLYFKRLPNVEKWVKRTIAQAERGYVYNEFGRAFKFPKNFAFKAPNYAIQGGTADWIKSAMVNIGKEMKGMKSSMLLQVHDELLFNMVDSEKNFVYKIKDMMENVKPSGILPYTVGIDYSPTSWADKRSYDG